MVDLRYCFVPEFVKQTKATFAWRRNSPTGPRPGPRGLGAVLSYGNTNSNACESSGADVNRREMIPGIWPSGCHALMMLDIDMGSNPTQMMKSHDQPHDSYCGSSRVVIVTAQMMSVPVM